ncbi:hypothetical protein ACJO2E_02435 [Marinobacter sp. M1N3S26]|uniref:hypothetical protein n=1 Tax=Marinobacter sp. M1N3S26 TaxID=3382299 RepID=UPI00387AA45E
MDISESFRKLINDCEHLDGTAQIDLDLYKRALNEHEDESQELKEAIRSINEQLIISEGISVLHFYNENADEPAPEIKVLKRVLDK